MGYVRLKDIAAEAGVSINTVSRALHDKEDISVETRRRIKAIADELGYVPDVNASRLRSDRNSMIGVVLTHLDNTFYTRILQGINDAFSDTGYTILALASDERLEEEEAILKTLMANRVAGLIIVPSQDLVNTLDYDHLGVPHITIVRKGKRNTRSFFITDSFESGRLAARHFLAKGCSAPAYIGFDKPVSCNFDRLSGFRAALEEAGVSLTQQRTLACAATQGAAYKVATSLLLSDKQVDAIFVYNDTMALGVLRALHDLHLVAGKDVRVLGHDDIDESRYLVPSLSTVSVPRYELGYDSAKELIGLIERKASPQRNVIYTPHVVERES